MGTLNVSSLMEDKATADVDVSFRDNAGTPRFPWNLVKEDGQWKLDDQVSGEKIG